MHASRIQSDERLTRQIRRTGTGTARTVERRAGWLTTSHPLADAVRTACTHAEGRAVVGGVGCGQCWEGAIRGDELTRRSVARAGDGEAA